MNTLETQPTIHPYLQGILLTLEDFQAGVAVIDVPEYPTLLFMRVEYQGRPYLIVMPKSPPSGFSLEETLVAKGQFTQITSGWDSPISLCFSLGDVLGVIGSEDLCLKTLTGNQE